MRIVDEAHVEHQVGGAGDAAGEAERRDGDHRLIDLAAIAPKQLIPQLGRREVGRIEHRVGDLAERSSRAAFAGNAILRGPIGGKRMAATRLVVATNELRPRAIQVENFRRHSTNGMEQPGKRFRVESAAADVHSYCHRNAGAGIPLAIDERIEQCGWKIVDTIPAHVFQCVEDSGFARARHAGD